MSIKAFGARRVTESLDTIGNYLNEAAKIAAGVSPAHVIRLETDSATRLTDVLPELIKFRKGTARNFDLTVTGSNLLKAKAFKLVRGGLELKATTLSPPTAGGFTAHFVNVLDPVSGLYDAYVVDDVGQRYDLEDAVRIKVRNGHVSGTTPPVEQSALQFGGVVPVLSPGKPVDVVLVFRGGATSDVGDWYVSDKSGQPRSGWTITPATNHEAQIQNFDKQRQPDLVTLRITAPKEEAPGTYCLVGQTKGADPKDKLAFFIEIKKSSQQQS